MSLRAGPKAMTAMQKWCGLAEATPATRVEVLQRVRRAVVTSAQAALTNVKRLYKAAGFSEADIHTVIPDRPLPAKHTPPAPTPQPRPSPPPADALGRLKR
jgi:hypothetical protein